jgi:hypothetical protein
MTVTVVAPDATTSDMLATAVAVLGEREGLQLADEYGAAAFMVLAPHGGGAPLEFRSERWRPEGPAQRGRVPQDEDQGTAVSTVAQGLKPCPRN